MTTRRAPRGSIRRVAFSCADPAALARFYVGLGFVAGPAQTIDAASRGAEGRASVITLRLGEQEIELVRYATPGRPIEPGAQANDSDFQHIALVTRDMKAAFARLDDLPGWHPISRGDAPIRLPASSGGVSAFKFRDPEGHPLELLAFPEPPLAWRGGDGLLLGIDHSAIAVSDTEASERFYAGLGFARTGGSINEGHAQTLLDGLDDVRVAVSALATDADAAPMHLELLAYTWPTGRKIAHGETDIAATRLILAEDDAHTRQVTDPDGHRLIIPAV